MYCYMSKNNPYPKITPSPTPAMGLFVQTPLLAGFRRPIDQVRR
jgi:hypothetical protein